MFRPEEEGGANADPVQDVTNMLNTSIDAGGMG
jgi:hypothetical protein